MVLISVPLGSGLCSELQQQLEKHSWIPWLPIWASNFALPALNNAKNPPGDPQQPVVPLGSVGGVTSEAEHGADHRNPHFLSFQPKIIRGGGVFLEGVTEGSGFPAGKKEQTSGQALAQDWGLRSGGALSWGGSGCSFPFHMGKAWSQGTVGISIRVPHPLL